MEWVRWIKAKVIKAWRVFREWCIISAVVCWFVALWAYFSLPIIVCAAWAMLALILSGIGKDGILAERLFSKYTTKV